MTKNIRIFNNFKKVLNNERLKLVTVSLAIGFMLTGCGLDTTYNQQLDKNSIDTNTTTVSERAEYYKSKVDDYVDKMSEEEKDNYYVVVNVIYEGKEQYGNDNLIFFRNDDVYKGDIKNSSDEIQLTPGIYSVISHKVTENNGNLGEIEILTPGTEVTIVVDYINKNVTLKEQVKTK